MRDFRDAKAMAQTLRGCLRGEARPTAAFQRVEERAEIHAQEMGQPVVTGAHMLVGIFLETRSPAAQLLGEHGVTRARAIELIAQGAREV